MKIMQMRRSVRSYSGDPVPMEKLNLILQAGMMAPSGRAIRPWELIVVRDKQKLIDLSSSRMGGAARMLAGADLAIVGEGGESLGVDVIQAQGHTAVAFLAGTLPARKASKKNPIDALRYE